VICQVGIRCVVDHIYLDSVAGVAFLSIPGDNLNFSPRGLLACFVTLLSRASSHLFWRAIVTQIYGVRNTTITYFLSQR
jgi:drug/metabolite transporter (DMT)-like permease